MESYHGTTILSVRRGNSVAMGGDGQVTLGSIVVKASARKVRRLFREQVLAGFAGGVGPLDYFGPRWEKVSAALDGLSRGIKSVDPTARRAIGTAGWGHGTVGCVDSRPLRAVAQLG